MNGEWQNHYPYFESNQVLTNEHLNELSDFLFEQIRLSRVQLSGIGIANGLTFHRENGSIYLYEGFGITSEGYLIQLDGDLLDDYQRGSGTLEGELEVGMDPSLEYSRYRKYEHYKTYTDPSPDQYWFNGPAASPTQIPLVELLTEDGKQAQILARDAEEADFSLIKDADAGFWNEKVLLLFLEMEDESLKNCVGNDCDNKGSDRNLTVRVLMADKEAIANWEGEHCRNAISKVDLPGQTIYRGYNLPQPHSMPRFVNGLMQTNTGLADITKYEQIADAYRAAIGNSANELAALMRHAKNNYASFLGITDRDHPGIDTLKNMVLEDVSLQTAHDHLKLLSQAYNEFIDLAFFLKKDAFNEDYVFCRHLMLGTADRDGDFNIFPYDAYRNYFIATPITPNQDQNILKAQLMFERMMRMIEAYQPVVVNESKAPEWLPAIVPSQEDEYPLGHGVIPDFYNSDLENLRLVWNPDLAVQELENHVYSFRPDFYADPAPDFVKEPLLYNIDAFPFFKIESLLGLPMSQAKDLLEKAKVRYNLAFNIKTLQLDPQGNADYRPYRFLFEDLQADFELLRQQTLCLLDNLKNAVDPKDLSLVVNAYHSNLPFDPLQFEDYIGGARAVLDNSGVVDFVFDTGKKRPDLELLLDNFKILEDLVTVLVLMMEDRIEHTVRPYLTVCELGNNRYLVIELQKRLASYRQFLASCMRARWTVLGAMVNQRTQAMIDQYEGIFKNFARKHPGMEHLGGVYKGGTFILVGAEPQKGDGGDDLGSTPTAPSEPGGVTTDPGASTGGGTSTDTGGATVEPTKDEPVKSDTSGGRTPKPIMVERVAKTSHSDASAMENSSVVGMLDNDHVGNTKGDAGGATSLNDDGTTSTVKGDQTPGIVVADFSLPYLCCDSVPTLDLSGLPRIEIPLLARPDGFFAEPNDSYMIDVLANDHHNPRYDGSVTIVSVGAPVVADTGKPFEVNPTVKPTQDGDRIGFETEGSMSIGKGYINWFPYTITDGQGQTSTANVYVMVPLPVTGTKAAIDDVATFEQGEEGYIDVLENDCFDIKTSSGALSLPGGTYTDINSNPIKVEVDQDGYPRVKFKADNVGQDEFRYLVSFPDGDVAFAKVRVTVKEACDCCRELRIFDETAQFFDVIDPAEVSKDFELRFVSDTGQLFEGPIYVPVVKDGVPFTTEISLTKDYDGIQISSGKPGPYTVKYAVALSFSEAPSPEYPNGRTIYEIERTCKLDLYDYRPQQPDPTGGSGSTTTTTKNPDITIADTYYDPNITSHLNTGLLLYELDPDGKDPKVKTALEDGTYNETYSSRYLDTLALLKNDFGDNPKGSKYSPANEMYAKVIESLFNLGGVQKGVPEGSPLLRVTEQMRQDLAELAQSGAYDPKDPDNPINKVLGAIQASDPELQKALDGLRKLG